METRELYDDLDIIGRLFAALDILQWQLGYAAKLILDKLAEIGYHDGDIRKDVTED